MAAQCAVASQAWTLGDSSPALTTVCVRFPTRKATAQCLSARQGCPKDPSQSPIAGQLGQPCGLPPNLQKSSRKQCPAHKFSSASQQKHQPHPPHPYDTSKQALHLQRRYPEARPLLAFSSKTSKENGESSAKHPIWQTQMAADAAAKRTHARTLHFETISPKRPTKLQSLQSRHIYHHTAESPTAASTRALNQI